MAGRPISLDNNPEPEQSSEPQSGSDTQGEVVFAAAARCLLSRIPFAVCHLPGENRLDFFCGLARPVPTAFKQTQDGNRRFEIGPWLAPWSERITIGSFLTADQICDILPGSTSLPTGLVTSPSQFQPDRVISKEEYISAVSAITERCSDRNGKTVYSRVIAGENPSLDITDAARELFTTFHDSFGFLYYTPMTGCWLGASPETLLDFDYDTRRVATMSFAGTRPASDGDTPWDDKNLRENKFVADYICGNFRQLGIEPEVSAPYTVRYGVIQHLRRDISAILPSHINYHDLLDLLNPTPALCGTPLDSAIKDIKEFELHTRGCYGGFIGIHQNLPSVPPSVPNPANPANAPSGFRGFKSFVNLRSARISLSAEGRFEILAGGGIISGSDPASEWAESEAKASRLLTILSTPRR